MTEIDGDTILYHYFQKDLQKVDFPFFIQSTMRFVLDLGIWIHPNDFIRLPIVEPFCVRDQSVVTNRKLWGNPQPNTGFMMDDNSMVKNIVKGNNKIISSKTISEYNGKNLGKGFVASHVWRMTNEKNTLSNQDHSLFTFIPNIVWLPKQVSKLTDREGSFVQTIIQEISIHIYKKCNFHDAMNPIIESCWQKLDSQQKRIIPESALPSIESMSFVRLGDEYIKSRIEKIKIFSKTMSSYADFGELPKHKVLSSKYDPFINTIDKTAAKKLATWMEQYSTALHW
jgi:hypothetical protein